MFTQIKYFVLLLSAALRRGEPGWDGRHFVHVAAATKLLAEGKKATPASSSCPHTAQCYDSRTNAHNSKKGFSSLLSAATSGKPFSSFRTAVGRWCFLTHLSLEGQVQGCSNPPYSGSSTDPDENPGLEWVCTAGNTNIKGCLLFFCVLV